MERGSGTRRPAMAGMLVLALALGAGTARAQASEPIRIGWVYAMANAPVLIAERNEMFAEEGLAPTLESFTSGPLIRKGLNEGTLDVAYIGVPPIVHWSAKGRSSRSSRR